MTRVQRWEHRTEVPLLLLAVAFLVTYAWPIVDPRLDHTLEETLRVVFWTVWGAFCLDFLIRVLLADRRGRLVAVALMVVGIALVGSVTAAVATWFIQHAQAEHDTV